MEELMLRIDREKKTFDRLRQISLHDAELLERYDVQKMIRNSPNSFCEELGETIWFVGEEVAPAEFVQDRIDLLGVDRDGVAVVVEIKRDSHKLHLLQALSYAGMVAKWEPSRFIEELRRYNAENFPTQPQTFEAAKDELEENLEEADFEGVNRSQRIVLLAEDFDFEVLVTAEWLTEQYELDIRCYRLVVARQNEQDFLSCNRVYPPPELTDIATRRRRTSDGVAPRWDNWGEALSSVENSAVTDFFRQEIDAGCDSTLASRKLKISVGGRRRYYVSAKSDRATVTQFGRFANDLDFWKQRLGPECKLAEKTYGRRLRFYLRTKEDFARFKNALSSELSDAEFSSKAEDTIEDAGNEPE